MPKGKPWTAEEESKLKQLVDANTPLHVIASELGKTDEALRQKVRRLGLEVVERAHAIQLLLPEELPSVEEALKILAGALRAAGQSKIDRIEVQRLHVVAVLAKTYKELLADYINYRGIEAKLIELEAKYAKVAEKTKSDASKPNIS